MDWLERHSLDNDSNYAYIASKIDIENYINYMQIEIFANNLDWPDNNLKKWNTTNPESKWKWFLYDLDFSFGYVPYNEGNIFDYTISKTKLLQYLLKNNNFKTTFINNMMTLLQTSFKTNYILNRIDKMMNEIISEIPRDQNRWSLNASNMNKQLTLIKKFAEERPGMIIKELQKYFRLQ